MSEDELRVWVSEDKPEVKAALPSLGSRTTKVITLSHEQVADSLREFLAQTQSLQAVDTPEESPFFIDEIELSLAVNATGGIELVGKLEAGAQAGIKVTLKRKAQICPTVRSTG